MANYQYKYLKYKTNQRGGNSTKVGIFAQALPTESRIPPVQKTEPSTALTTAPSTAPSTALTTAPSTDVIKSSKPALTRQPVQTGIKEKLNQTLYRELYQSLHDMENIIKMFKKEAECCSNDLLSFPGKTDEEIQFKTKINQLLDTLKNLTFTSVNINYAPAMKKEEFEKLIIKEGTEKINNLAIEQIENTLIFLEKALNEIYKSLNAIKDLKNRYDFSVIQGSNRGTILCPQDPGTNECKKRLGNCDLSIGFGNCFWPLIGQKPARILLSIKEICKNLQKINNKEKCDKYIQIYIKATEYQMNAINQILALIAIKPENIIEEKKTQLEKVTGPYKKQ